jgi:hypothetical protein
MRPLLLLTLLLMLASLGHSQSTTGSNESSSITVLNSKWYKSRQAIEKVETADTAPAPAMTTANKNFERNRRINDPAGVRDPNADTLDARSAALEKSVQQARTPQAKPVDGYAYRVKIQNASKKVVEVVFWEYQFIDPSNAGALARRQFLCGVNIKPDKEKELQAFSLSGPSDVVSAVSLSNQSQVRFQEKIVINRVEYSDGTIWQRKDWNFAEVKQSIARAIGTPWGTEMCRGL